MALSAFPFGRGDRIAAPSSCFPGGTPLLKKLRQTCLFAGSTPVALSDRIASPSRCARRTRGAAYAASSLRGSFRILPPIDKKTLLACEKGLILVGATGFEPATLCSQSRCASQAAPRPVSKRRRQTITNFTPVNAVSKYSFKLNVRDFKPGAQT
jgi:hypothetical protein